MKSFHLALILFLISVLVSFALVNPKVKKWTQSLLIDTDRRVLSQLDTSIDKMNVKILKIKEMKGLFLEIYKKTDASPQLLDRVMLTDKKDAFYSFENKKLNLFLKDINEDKIPEILVPTIDKNMTAHLNIFSFSSVTEKLEKISEH